MIPQAHICCVCKSSIVWTDCLPAICYGCRELEARKKAEGISFLQSGAIISGLIDGIPGQYPPAEYPTWRDRSPLL